MKILKSTLLALIAIIVLAVIAALLYAHHLSHRALPDYNANIKLIGLHAPVEVYRDKYAIPHVYAQDEHDLYMTVGYLLAEDRLWQMDLLRRVTEGRLAEIFGAGYVDTDVLLRALRFREKSEKIWAQADTLQKAALIAFSNGINQYIHDHQNKLPLEFAILGYKPDAWKPVHSLNLIGYMAWDLKAGWSEIVVTEIQKKVDSLRYTQILPDLTGNKSVVYPDFKDQSISALPELMLKSALLQGLGVDVFDGSNNWAVSGSKSVTGKPLLANDMHLGLNIPGIWYQMHQCIPGKLNVTGLVLPGAPVIVCGHNDSIAWGMTNTYVDNLDFYEEKVNPKDSNQYEYMGTWKNFNLKKLVIKIRGGSQVERILRFSQRGPVVTQFKKIPGKVITMHWVGDEMSDEIRTIYLLNRANNWNDFTNALRTFTSISQNVVYADKKGNIGLYCAAGVPIRKRDAVYQILPGWTDEYNWKGYVPFDELPFMYNPASGYVVSANNQTTKPDYPYHIGTWYALPSRFDRISELLTSKQLLSVNDFKAIQTDQHSKLAEKYMPAILNTLEKTDLKDETENKAFQMLKSWDFNMGRESVPAAIFENMYLQMFRCTFADELGENLFNTFFTTTSVSRKSLDKLWSIPGSPWFDNVNTPDKKETMNDMILCSFRTTLSNMKMQYGKRIESWQWGRMHLFTLSHPLAQEKILDMVFHLNRGPYHVGGSFHTVCPFSYPFSNPFNADHGASHRHIFDLSNWDNSLTVIPTGNSGISSSKHYCDQTDLYIKGKYHPDYFSKNKLIANALYHMKFIPK